MTRIWWIFIRALKILKKLHFDWSFLCKVYIIWRKKVQRSYLSWHGTIMPNLKKNWLVVWKVTLGIWHVFTRTHGCVKRKTLLGSFSTKQKMYEIKHYRGVICNDTEEWWKFWRGIGLSFQNWIWQFVIQAHENLNINGLLLSKIYNACANKVQRSYLWSHWRFT